MKFAFIALLCISFRTTAQNIPKPDYERTWRDYNIPVKEGHIEDVLFQYTNRVNLLINHTATLDKLVKIKESARKHEIYITYRDLTFDSAGKLQAVGLDVANERGFLEHVTALYLTDTTHFGIFLAFTGQNYVGPFFVGYYYK